MEKAYRISVKSEAEGKTTGEGHGSERRQEVGHVLFG